METMTAVMMPSALTLLNSLAVLAMMALLGMEGSVMVGRVSIKNDKKSKRNNIFLTLLGNNNKWL